MIILRLNDIAMTENSVLHITNNLADQFQHQEQTYGHAVFVTTSVEEFMISKVIWSSLLI